VWVDSKYDTHPSLLLLLKDKFPLRGPPATAATPHCFEVTLFADGEAGVPEDLAAAAAAVLAGLAGERGGTTDFTFG
jgi:hypothetical protein